MSKQYRKRNLRSEDGSWQVRVSTSSNSDLSRINQKLLTESFFQIEVILRSLSKAKMNDPDPVVDCGDYLKKLHSTNTQQSPATGEVVRLLRNTEDGRSCNSNMRAQSGQNFEQEISQQQQQQEEEEEGNYEENGLIEDDAVSFRSEHDQFAEFEWLEQMDGRVTLTNTLDPNQRQIGYCDGKLIRRNRISHIFYDEMEAPSVETSELAFGLFDRYGQLRKEFKVHEFKKGSKIWQDEFDRGDILLIEWLHFEKQYRRLGLGRRLVHAMLEKTMNKSHSFIAIAGPGYPVRELEDETEGMTNQRAELARSNAMKTSQKFWRSLGFRRVGSSQWFAWASDPNHLCHQLSAKDDFDPPEYPERKQDSRIQLLLQSISEFDDQNLCKTLQNLFENASQEDPRWLVTDDEGNTVLHASATNCRPQSVQWLLSRNPGLLNCRNDDGETPLEALEFYLESCRTAQGSALQPQRHISDKFVGFGKDAVQCLVTLKGLTDPSPETIRRISYGCTCGLCIEGFLSPRMAFALKCQAEIQHDTLNGSMIFHQAMLQDRFAGDGYHWKTFYEKISELPECRNDHEFGFVSRMCGYESVSLARPTDSST